MQQNDKQITNSSVMEEEINYQQQNENNKEENKVLIETKYNQINPSQSSQINLS